MNTRFFIIINLLCLSFFQVNAQSTIEIKLPQNSDWNTLEEGKPYAVNFDLSGQTEEDGNFYFEIIQGKIVGMEMDSSGYFTWAPAFTDVDRIEKLRIFQLLIRAKSDSGKVATKAVDLRVSHVNRPPVVNEIKPFYIKYNTSNTYRIDNSIVYDLDNDPVVIIPSIEDLPEGFSISSQGEMTWNPSFSQFKSLKETPMYIKFYVQDQPAKSQTEGRVKLVATQLDLPPAITVVPKIRKLQVRENETLNLRFYLSDPNGDDDIETFEYLTNEKNLPEKLLIKNTPNQYEFTWMPGYDFVKDPLDSLSFYVDFYVIDKTQKREVVRIDITVTNTLNRQEEDSKLFNLYRGTMLQAWELMEQLKEKEKELKTAYNRAKKGKKQRSVLNAGLGAVTGLSSVVTRDNNDLQRSISTLGGTTVLTIGTLEATEVIGRSTKDLVDRLNYIIEKKNDIQTKGDIFARDYSLKSARRTDKFTREMDDFMKLMQLKGLVALELDATWEPKVRSTDKAMKQTFKDYTNE